MSEEERDRDIDDEIYSEGDEVVLLKRDLASAKAELKSVREEWAIDVRQLAEERKLHQDTRRLVERMRGYADHHNSCGSTSTRNSNDCSCGFSKALVSLESL